MLRYKRQVRLSESELRQYRLLVPTTVTPKTIETHDQQLERAAAVWTELDCAEGTLLAALAEDLKIEK